jgi:hypothetical protein
MKALVSIQLRKLSGAAFAQFDGGVSHRSAFVALRGRAHAIDPPIGWRLLVDLSAAQGWGRRRLAL